MTGEQVKQVKCHYRQSPVDRRAGESPLGLTRHLTGPVIAVHLHDEVEP